MAKRLKQEGDKDKDILLHGYQVARAWSGLIVSLSTGIIVFTATFRRYMVAEGQPLEAINLLIVSWVTLGIAILFGIIYLSTLIPQLNKGVLEHLNLYAGKPRAIASIQWFAFLAGLGLFAYFAIVNLG